MDAVVADFDGDLSVRELRPDEGRLDFNMGLLLGIHYVPEEVRISQLIQLYGAHDSWFWLNVLKRPVWVILQVRYCMFS